MKELRNVDYLKQTSSGTGSGWKKSLDITFLIKWLDESKVR